MICIIIILKINQNQKFSQIILLLLLTPLGLSLIVKATCGGEFAST